MPRSTQIALAYLILGLSCVVMLGALLSTVWTGSVTRLWQYVRDFPFSFFFLLIAMLINFAISALVYRVEQRERTLRLLCAGIARALFVVSAFGAIQALALWFRGQLPDALPSGAVWMRLIGALIYGWLAVQVIRLTRASNNRWRGP